MTDTTYAENIIEPIIQDLRKDLKEISVFKMIMNDMNMLRQGNIQKMDWPANLTDMNPIEYVWDYLGRAMSNRENPPSALQELTAAVQEEWDNMPDYFIDNSIQGMPRRVSQMVERRGDHIDY